MKKTISCLICSAVLFVLSSCTITGLTSGYNRLTDAEKQRVVDTTMPLENVKADDKLVHRLTVEQLKDYIQRHPRVVVHEFTTFCRSVHCVHPYNVSQVCKAKGYELVVVATLYDHLFQFLDSGIPMFVIDNRAFNTNRRDRYQRLFFDELTGTTQKERDYHIYHLFRNGRYQGTLDFITKLGE